MTLTSRTAENSGPDFVTFISMFVHTSSKSDMHQALRLIEIFEIVCSFATQNTLACLARTCRTFEDSSLNTLWHEYALACLLPDSDAILDSEQVHGNTISRRLPTWDHWERMRKYMSRIVVVRLKNGFFSPSTALSPMYPKLKEIRINSRAIHSFNISLFRYMNGPSVIHLELNIESSRWKTMSEFVASIPNARRVQVIVPRYSDRPPENMLQSLSRAIRDWEHLGYGSFNFLDALAYEHLCQLETLTSFRIDISSHDNYARLRDAVLPPVPFPVLTDTQLMACTITELV
ncbi:hypothetical protein J3R83DRAFT_3786 [Lanmaoa asiatica]|nr:hypothetical protein J3R83DRAFT_3786 [Lanmaoa asiatica]